MMDRSDALRVPTTMRFALLAVLSLAACPSTPVTVGPAPEPAKSAAPAPTPIGPRVIVRNGPKPGAVEIVTSAPVDLDAKLYVEQQAKDGSWSPVLGLDMSSMKLVEACNDKVDACISLPKDRVFRPVRWSGMSCSSQCNGSCDKNVHRAGMPHRFVVKTCDGKERFEGPAFDLPKQP